MQARMLGGISGLKLRFRLLGRAELAIVDGSGGTPRLSSTKGLALLSYLAMHGRGPVSRTVLADLLWSDRPDQHARQNLRQCLMTLRRDLGPDAASILVADDRSVAISADAVEVDALQFVACAAAAELEERLRCLDIPWAPFLDGFHPSAEAFEEWAAAERNRLASIAVRTFSELAEACAARGDGERAILAMERLVSVDPAEEERHRRLLLLEAKHRGVDAAIARSKALAGELKRQLDVDPEAATRALIDEIRRGAALPGPLQISLNPSASKTMDTLEQSALETPASSNEGLESSSGVGAAAWPPSPSLHAEEETRSDTSANPIGPDRRPARRLTWSPAGMTAAFAATALTLVIGFVAVSNSLSVHQSQAPAEFADPWRSPTIGPANSTSASRSLERVIPIVVLPFTGDADVNPSQSTLADEITDDLINMLSRAYRFRVISRNTSRSLKGMAVDPAALRSELGVRYALEGSVRARGDNLHVNVELVDTSTRLAVWSDQIARKEGDRQTVLNEIVIQIARALQVETRRIEVRRNESPADVQQLVDKAWITMTGGGVTLERVEQARNLFEEALRKDPDSLQAQIGLGAYHVQLVSELLTPDPGPHIEKALSALEAAVAKAPNSETAYYFLARAQRNKDDFEAALRSFTRTIELNPSYTDAYAQVGLTLLFLRRPAEALDNIRYGMRLSPKDPALPFWLRFAAEAEIELGNYSEAISDLERSVEMAPRQLRAWGVLTAAHALAGNAMAVQKHLSKVKELGSGFSDEQLLKRIGRSSRLGPNRVHDGFRMALSMPSSTGARGEP